MFQKFSVDIRDDIFDDLIRAHEWSALSSDRQGAMLVAPINGLIPVVRTTCPTIHCQAFGQIHQELIDAVNLATGNKHAFNNAMAELYDASYTRMGFHTDCALDLQVGTVICIFSCYESGHRKNPRKLIVRDKTSGEIREMIMDHISVIQFDTNDNSQHVHKIVGGDREESTRWLGLTLRTSKTYINCGDSDEMIICGTRSQLRLADDGDKKKFCELKKQENKYSDFNYPELDFSIAHFRLKDTM